MAGDWIKMRADLFTHPKVFKIAEALQLDELAVVGALFCFWAWADKHSVDGRVDGATSRLVDKTVRVDGLSAALESVGWLSIDADGIAIPRFTEHNGDSAKERSLKNQRQARWRERKAAGLVVDTAPSTNASTREEKRREENITTTTTRPTVDDVAAYVATRDIKINPQNFVDYYTANGWKVGRNTMKDWKAAVRTWEKRENANTKNPVNGTANTGRRTTADAVREARQRARDRHNAGSPDLGGVVATQ